MPQLQEYRNNIKRGFLWREYKVAFQETGTFAKDAPNYFQANFRRLHQTHW